VARLRRKLRNQRPQAAQNTLIAKSKLESKLISYGAPICSKLLTPAPSAAKVIIAPEGGLSPHN
jgi:hypothetical protein